MTRRAAFLDRDGTIIQDTGFIGKPEDVELLPGAGAAIRRLNAAGWPVVVVTNQSGIAQGMFSQADYDRVAARVEELVRGEGARIDATYFCPHHPDVAACECRKPGTLLYRRAAEDLGLDLKRSWYVGDRLRDVEPANTLGGRGILLSVASTPPQELEKSRGQFPVVHSLDAAVALIIESGKP